jgi:hypothetical protein
VFFHRYVLPLWQTIFGVRPADLCSLTGAIFRARMFRTLRPVDCFPRPPEQDFLQVCRRLRAESRERRVTRPQQGLGKAKKGVQLFLEADPYLNSMDADLASARP